MGDTDLELLQTSDALYHHLGLKRTYFSSFHPLEQTPLSTCRRRRTCASSGSTRPVFSCATTAGRWRICPTDTNLRADMDPKLAWAQANLRNAGGDQPGRP
ncbi:MAG: hypothetical protein R2854_18165 [Caldilineaceae bacterium]